MARKIVALSAQERWLAWVPVLLLMVLAGATWWLDRVVREAEEKKQTALTGAPEAFLINFQAVETDISGHPMRRLTAETLKHYAADGNKLTEPRATELERGKAPLSIRAQTGQTDAKNAHAVFDGQVEVRREASGGDPALVLNSEHLEVDTVKKSMSVPGHARISQMRASIEGDGLEVDNTTQVLTLKSNVRTTILPHALKRGT